MTSDLFKGIIADQEWLLIISGIWPKKNASLVYKLRKYATLFVTLTLTIILTNGLIGSGDMVKLLECLFFYTENMSHLIKRESFVFNKKIFLKLLEYLNDYGFMKHSRKYESHIIKALNTTKYLMKFYSWTVVIAIISDIVFPVLEKKALPTIPFQGKGYQKYIIYSLEILGLAITAWNNLAIDLLVVGLLQIASAHLDILYEKLAAADIDTKVQNTISTETYLMEYFRQCAIYHTKIIRFVKTVEKVFSLGLLVQLGGSIVVICNSGFHILLIPWISIQMITAVGYFLAIIMQLSMYCWFGNEVKEKSVKILDACYMSRWYEFTPKVRRVILLIMERSKTPLLIEASRFGNLSLESFATIMRWSYKYFAVLQNMYYADSSY